MDKKVILFQRRLLGILCALLVPSCLLFGLLGTNLPYWYCSVSATYYANSKICMIGLLFATSVVLFSYSGYDWCDRTLSLIEAISALGVIVFPCFTPGVTGKVGLFSLPIQLSHILHCASASTLFICFGITVTFVFTKGDRSNTQKRKRNIVFYVCGGCIFAGILSQVIATLANVTDGTVATLVNEFIMLEAFAFAWLVKAGCFVKLND